MAEMLFFPANRGHQFGCYGERGLMSYFMFVELPNRLPEFLQSMQFPQGVENPFANPNASITKSIIFSELSFGSEGFGSPDGAIYVEWPEPAMIFIEVKVNETYEQSFKNESYNSTLKGQLELKWRLVSSYFSDRESALNKTEYVHEDMELKEFYTLDNERCDEFYRAEHRENKDLIGSWRRLQITAGVNLFLDELRRAKERVFYLAVTNDKSNPFDHESIRLPRCYDKDWTEAKSQFCWLPITAINGPIDQGEANV